MTPMAAPAVFLNPMDANQRFGGLSTREAGRQLELSASHPNGAATGSNLPRTMQGLLEQKAPEIRGRDFISTALMVCSSR